MFEVYPAAAIPVWATRLFRYWCRFGGQELALLASKILDRSWLHFEVDSEVKYRCREHGFDAVIAVFVASAYLKGLSEPVPYVANDPAE